MNFDIIIYLDQALQALKNLHYKGVIRVQKIIGPFLLKLPHKLIKHFGTVVYKNVL